MRNMGDVKGVTLRFDPKRKLPWGVWIEAIIAGKERRGAKFFATEAEGLIAYAAASEEVAKLRAEAEEDERRKRALAIPPLPIAPRGVVLFEPFIETWLNLHVKQREAATYRGVQRGARQAPVADDAHVADDR